MKDILIPKFELETLYVFRSGSVKAQLTMDFTETLNLVQKSQVLSEIGESFKSNLVSIGGTSLTTSGNPVYLDTTGGGLKQSEFQIPG